MDGRLVLCVPVCPIDWCTDCGGTRVYMAKDEDEEVIGRCGDQMIEVSFFIRNSCCRCLRQGTLFLSFSVIKTRSRSPSMSTIELWTLLITATSSLLHFPIKNRLFTLLTHYVHTQCCMAVASTKYQTNFYLQKFLSRTSYYSYYIYIIVQVSQFPIHHLVWYITVSCWQSLLVGPAVWGVLHDLGGELSTLSLVGVLGWFDVAIGKNANVHSTMVLRLKEEVVACTHTQQDTHTHTHTHNISCNTLQE